MSSIMFRVCMSVCLSYETAFKAGSYVCTYGAILRIRLTEEYQSVWNKQAEEQQQCLRLGSLFRITWIVKYRSRCLVVAVLPNTAISAFVFSLKTT